jgi:hypothetical protein
LPQAISPSYNFPSNGSVSLFLSSQARGAVQPLVSLLGTIPFSVVPTEAYQDTEEGIGPA